MYIALATLGVAAQRQAWMLGLGLRRAQRSMTRADDVICLILCTKVPRDVSSDLRKKKEIGSRL